MALPEETRVYLLAPIIRGRKGEYRRELNELMRKGFQRVKIDGEFHDIEDAPNLDKKIKHDIEVVVDRIVVGPEIGSRLAESFETALRLADGIAFVEFADELDATGAPKRLIFSEKFADPISGFTIPEIEPRLFSFNNPYGACPVCDGLGTEQKIDPNLIVPDATVSLRDGAILPWSKTSAPYYQQTLQAVVKHYGQSMGSAWEDLSEEARAAVLFGTGKTPIAFVYDDGLRTYKSTKPFEGVIGNLERRYKETESAGMREEIERYMSTAPCVACAGYRLKPESLAVKIGGLHIGQVTEM
jgi:excinuclease ABC subunit A